VHERNEKIRDSTEIDTELTYLQALQGSVATSVQSGITAQNNCSETFFLRSHTSASRSGNAGSFTDWYLLCPRSVGISKGKLRKISLPENSNESPKRDGTRRGLKQMFLQVRPRTSTCACLHKYVWRVEQGYAGHALPSINHRKQTRAIQKYWRLTKNMIARSYLKISH